MNAIQHEVNRLSTLETEVSDIRENNRIFIRQNRDVLTNYQELQKQYSLLKEQYRLFMIFGLKELYYSYCRRYYFILFRILTESKDQLQLSLDTSSIWQKEYTEREEIVNGTLAKQNDHIKCVADSESLFFSYYN